LSRAKAGSSSGEKNTGCNCCWWAQWEGSPTFEEELLVNLKKKKETPEGKKSKGRETWHLTEKRGGVRRALGEGDSQGEGMGGGGELSD